jgi:hypothetical protein
MEIGGDSGGRDQGVQFGDLLAVGVDALVRTDGRSAFLVYGNDYTS